MSQDRIAIIGMACRYPDAGSPAELWTNALARRRAFRRMPDERTPLGDYFAADPRAQDRFYSPNAAVLDGYEFDRVRFRIAGSTYRATDMTHWLALDMADRALADAGFPAGDGLPRATTAVIVGNTLTGEFSRASLMRLRWPYVRRTVLASLRGLGWNDERCGEFLDGLESTYKAPFPEVDEDTLAGGLANTIAGRICNYFDLGGGGYTVDGACSSSLLSVAHACKALVDRDADVAIAGGVDLSLDPFELVGFAKTGALATSEMRVYDRRSAGFWPGEGCGMLVLARERDALARKARIYSFVSGWGISSDGSGGITRPEVAGQVRALERAYARAGVGADTVGYVEGHGTGTAVGDTTEITALSAVRRAANPAAPPAVLGTIKANIGHTKAAAGVAGLIKAAMAVHNELIPPTTGCGDPHPELTTADAALRVSDRAEPWPADRPIRASVSSMGFGGINTHIVLEHPDDSRRARGPVPVPDLGRSAQDAEVLLFDAADRPGLRAKLADTAERVARLSYAELADLAAVLQSELTDQPLRAAVVVASPAEAHHRLTTLIELIDGGAAQVVDAERGVFHGRAGRPPRIVFAFPGQGSGRGGQGALRQRFAQLDGLPSGPDGDPVATDVAQPRIAVASIAALHVLDQLGITAQAAVGHSLGELTALHWAGVFDEDALVRLAAERGRIMAGSSRRNGAMAGISAGPEDVTALIGDGPVVIAGLNAPEQTVVSGPVPAITEVMARAQRGNLRATRLPVSHAFHSPLVEPAAEAFDKYLAGESFRSVRRPVASTVTGAMLDENTDVHDLLVRQVVLPVRFTDAVRAAGADADLVIEAGPGQVLTGLMRHILPVAVVSMDTDAPSLAGTLGVAAAAFVLGAPVRHSFLFQDRQVKSLPDRLRPLVGMCETIPPAAPGIVAEIPVAGPESEPLERADFADGLELIRTLAAQRAELPVDAVNADSKLLDELHLSSITVGQIVNDAVRALGLTQPAAPLNFATATVREIAEALDELAGLAGDSAQPQAVAGVDAWIRAFGIEYVDTPLLAPVARSGDGSWQVFAPDGHPFAESYRQALDAADVAGGVLLCAPADPDLVLQAAQAAADAFILVHHGRPGGADGMAKTLFLERPSVATLVIELPASASSIDWITAEARAMTGFTEVRYDEAGIRTCPVLRPVPEPMSVPDPVLDSSDVLLVTGGGKGITAECALTVAVDTGAAVVLLGRAGPDRDSELAANLDRFTAAGVRFGYVRADVTVPEEVRAAVEAAQTEFGPITAVLHGAGRNVPRRLADLDSTELRATLATKVDGLQAVLDCVDPRRLRLLVTFGSIIGRAGLAGEAHYAMANAAVTEATVAFGERNPGCRCVSLEWSVWSGVGMGERLGVVESLRHSGITPISAEEGLNVLRTVLGTPALPGVLVVSGRLTALPTVSLPRRDLPLLRFVDRVVVDQPGVELITEAELSTSSDPYLADHVVQGEQLVPAVLGLEAMAQVATAVTGRDEPVAFLDARFQRPIVVPAHASTTIRIAALVRDSSTVDVVVRSSETGFQVDHFAATCTFGRPELSTLDHPGVAAARLAMDPATELYGPVLFQGSRFQRLRGYRRISSTGYVAEVGAKVRPEWFAMFLPGRMLLGDPGARDAVMQAVQACRPDQTLLPVRIGRIVPGELGVTGGQLVAVGVERAREDNAIVWDVTVRDEAGHVVEIWEGLRLQVAGSGNSDEHWPDPLLAPYLERHAGALLGTGIEAVVEPGAGRTETALRRLLGPDVVVRHRPDGKPEVSSGHPVSVAHAAGLTFVVTGDGVACDVEPAVRRSDEDWLGLLGRDRFALARLMSADHDEDLSVAATRVWCAVECAQKAGRPVEEPLTLTRFGPDGWAVFSTGAAQVATFVTRRRTVFAIRGEGRS
ncbi:MAG: type I polyketide synthase [Kibdelosporangium sp.]